MRFGLDDDVVVVVVVVMVMTVGRLTIIVKAWKVIPLRHACRACMIGGKKGC